MQFTRPEIVQSSTWAAALTSLVLRQQSLERGLPPKATCMNVYFKYLQASVGCREGTRGKSFLTTTRTISRPGVGLPAVITEAGGTVQWQAFRGNTL